MGVSKNRGTPKSSILIGNSIINHPCWGTTIFGNTHIYTQNFCQWILKFGFQWFSDFHELFWVWPGITPVSVSVLLFAPVKDCLHQEQGWGPHFHSSDFLFGESWWCPHFWHFFFGWELHPIFFESTSSTQFTGTSTENWLMLKGVLTPHRTFQSGYQWNPIRDGELTSRRNGTMDSTPGTGRSNQRLIFCGSYVPLKGRKKNGLFCYEKCFGPKTRWWFQTFLCSPRKLGKIPILTNIFQRGWNHQLVHDS